MATFIIVLLTIISILSAIFVIGIILIQQNKAGGGLGAVSGGWTESTFGASADNVLTKATTWASAIFLISTLLLAAVTGRWGVGRKSIIESADIAEKPAAMKVEEAAKPVTEAVKVEEAKPAEAAPAKAEEAKPAEAAKSAEAAPAEEKK
ncbi:MAG: preprotein translocase subunit SecG [Victivallales bacterium]|nr:preprotein translocase subunit SecG [Victivallales bacterium]MBR5023431.1 preprotein translocase subunit SecG [Victivallales bacterium]